MRTIVPLGLLLVLAFSARGEPLVIENDVVRWTIGSNGLTQGLVEKQTGRAWGRTSPVALVKKAGKYYPATAVARRADLWQLGFGDSGVAIDWRVTICPRYFVVELASVRGEGAEEICLVRFDADIPENYGSWLNVRWNEQFAVAVLGLSDRVNTMGPPGWAAVYPEFGMAGRKAVLIAVPKARFLEVIQEVERDGRLASPRISGHWAKTSPDVRRGYLFTDLTEANADETIRFARLGEFGYIMIYSGTWSSSLGSYPVNTNNFPRGEESLKTVIDKCHAAGLKVGMHTLTSFVGKNDPLVRPKPDRRLLQDAEAVLAADVDASAAELRASTPLEGFPTEHAYYGDAKQGMTALVDDEIIQYRQIDPGSKTFLKCLRGCAGTRATPHRAGVKISHLCERYGCYLADLRTSLKDELADRVAGVFNRCGFDMIYFDGGECNMANGPYWYWVSQQQMSVYDRVRREILVQGSGGTAWTWHIFARGCCDDFAAVAPKPYLDYHKIADSWQHYTRSFMPADLGWSGFLDDTPEHPATSPDEVEFYAVRMLALDTPVSLETHLAALKKNGRTEELLRLLGEYERLRLGGTVPAAAGEKLRQGEWHLVQAGGKPTFHPIRYDANRVTVPGGKSVVIAPEAQPLRFRLQAAPSLAPAGSGENLVLLQADPPAELKLPEAKTPMPGGPAGSVKFLDPAGRQTSGLLIGAAGQAAGGDGKPLNLLKHRALAVTLRVEGPAPAASQPYPVLNVQLESGGKTYRDHYVDLDFRGERTLILPEPTTDRMLPEFRPAHANYAFKAAMYSFNYTGIVGLNFRWMRAPAGTNVRCAVARVEALAESAAPVKNPEIAVGSARLMIPAELQTGDYAEYWADGPIRIFDRNGMLRSSVAAPGEAPRLAAGRNEVLLGGGAPATAKLTVITLGPPLTVD